MVKVALVLAPTVAADFEKIVAHVNSLGTTWQAKVPKFDSLDDVKTLCGTDLKSTVSLPEKEDDSANIVIADEFDVRSNWPNCASVSDHVRDQSACGSCWAHGSAGAFNDRHCIKTGSTVLLSTEDTLANSGCGSCNGGQPDCVFDWISKTGVVTGGDYVDIGKGDTCAPYSLPTCQHHNWVPPTKEHPACPEDGYSTPGKFSSCKESAYPKRFDEDKVSGTPAYRVSGEDNIKSDITQHGSVQAVFTVYDDLPAYKSGVYHHTTGSQVGGHSVTIIGWGTEDGTPYWLVRNSWNTDWGNKGYFKIKRGNNECGIESGISASRYCEMVRKSCAGQVSGSVCATCDGDVMGKCANDGSCCMDTLCGGDCCKPDVFGRSTCCQSKSDVTVGTCQTGITDKCCDEGNICSSMDTCCGGSCCKFMKEKCVSGKCVAHYDFLEAEVV